MRLFWIFVVATTATTGGAKSWVDRRRRVLVASAPSSSEDVPVVPSQPPSPRIVWEELMEETKNEEEEDDLLLVQKGALSPPISTTTTLRQRMKSLLNLQEKNNNDDNCLALNQQQEQPEESEEEPHPLRTRLWEFQVHWRGPAADYKKAQHARQQHDRSSCSLLYDSTKLVLEFDPSGYVRLQPAAPAAGGHPDPNNIPDNGWMATGTWSVEASGGVSCSIPIPVLDVPSSSSSSSSSGNNDASQPQVLLLHRFEADLHLNPFGTHAKLTRGVVLRDRPTHPRQRRDVVGTFSGRGSGGPDTVDLSYATRRPPAAPRS